MTLIIEDRHVREMISVGDAIEALRVAYLESVGGRIIEADRSNMILPNGFLRVMAAAWPERKLAGYKQFHRINGRVRYAYHLYDSSNGEQLAILDANHLTALRTGACGGLGADILARPDANVVGIVGSGAEARSQLAGVLAVRPVEKIKVFSRTAERRRRFCEEVTAEFGIEATPCDDAPSALAGAEIIIVATATGSAGPAFFGEWLDHPGVHINSIGSTLPSQRELDEEVWRRVDQVVIDAALLLDESGDAIAARKKGTIDPERVALLGDLVARKVPGRVRDDDLTMYKSVGSALQDLAVAAWVYERAKSDADRFQRMPDFQSVTVVGGL